MNIDIKLIETIYLDNENLRELKGIFENSPLTIDSIPFDVDDASLVRLKMISNINDEIEFKDANNNILSLSGSELKNTYIPLIESNLGTRFNIISKRYNLFKNSLSAEEVITYYEGASAFFEDLYDTSFTQNDYDNLYEL
tara:strand:- start:44641 stop:45060 length:420 start_codon:yes stop_codon:yes gene_type:complete